MSLAAPPHVNLDEWESTWRLHDDAYELVAGVPTMTPSESGTNVDAAMAVRDALGQLRRTHRLLPNYGVHVRRGDSRETIRQPDLTVLPRNVDISRSYVEACTVDLVAEIVSPSSIERDWVSKRSEYAAAGIPNYVIVDVRDDAAPRIWLFDQIVTDAAGGTTYADPTGDGHTVTLHLPGCDPITITATDLTGAL